MSDSLADLLKRQQQSSTKAPETPPHDEAAEVAAIAKQQAAKAAVLAGRFLGKASKHGARASVQLSHQARQRLAEVTPEQWIKIRRATKKAGLVVLTFAGLAIITWGGTKAWQAWHSAPAVATKTKPAPTLKVQARMPDGTVKTITIPETAVAPATTAQPAPVPTPATPPPTVEVPATAVVPSTTTQPAPAVAPSTEAAPLSRALPQSPRQSQGVNARYHHTAPVLNQQKYQPDPLLAPRHRGQPNPVAKRRPVEPQEQQNMKALDQFFDKLNKEKPATQGNTNDSSQPAHQ